MSYSIEKDGFEMMECAFEAATLHSLETAISDLHSTKDSPESKKAYGLRNLLRRSPLIGEFATSGQMLLLARCMLGARAFPVRALFFDKTPDANWKVAWHQDVTIAVSSRIDQAGFHAWSVKDGIPHVQPPAEILENMLTLRLHLDTCDEKNGALKVIPGSHSKGRLNPEQIAQWKQSGNIVTCTAKRGDLLVMKPLLLHASSPAEIPDHRRILHIEYAAQDLPGGLTWYDSRP